MVDLGSRRAPLMAGGGSSSKAPKKNRSTPPMSAPPGRPAPAGICFAPWGAASSMRRAASWSGYGVRAAAIDPMSSLCEGDTGRGADRSSRARRPGSSGTSGLAVRAGGLVEHRVVPAHALVPLTRSVKSVVGDRTEIGQHRLLIPHVVTSLRGKWDAPVFRHRPRPDLARALAPAWLILRIGPGAQVALKRT